MTNTGEVKLTIDGREVSVPAGTTILEAARRYEINIPTLCHHPSLSPWGGCRLCLVEVDGGPKLAASCVMPVRPGMEVVTANERIVAARRLIIESLLSERNHFCMFCAQSGDCELQDLAYEHGLDHLTVAHLGREFPVDASHPHLAVDHNRCVLCGRCVRACREVVGNAVLDYYHRGARTVIGADLGRGLGDSGCISCGLCGQVCPTGAIYLRQRTHYAVHGKRRGWEVIESVCPLCEQLCPTRNWVRDNNIIKIEGDLEGPSPTGGQLCRRGRFEALETTGVRLLRPLVKNGNGDWLESSLDEALDLAAGELGRIVQESGPGSVVGLVSSRCGNEDLEAFRSFMDETLPEGRTDTTDGGINRAFLKAADGGGPNGRAAASARILEADFILAVGGDLWPTHPIVVSFIRSAILRNQARLTVIGGEGLLSRWARVRIGTERAETAGMIEEIIAALSGAGRSNQAGQRGLDPGEIGRVAEMLKRSRRPLIVAGPDPAGFGGAEGIALLYRLAGLIGWPGEKEPPLVFPLAAGNSLAARRLGLTGPDKPLAGAGPRAGLVLLDSADELTGDQSAVMADLEFAVIISPYLPAGQIPAAAVCLPKPAWLERDASYDGAGNGSSGRFKPRVLNPPVGITDTETVLAGLAKRLFSGRQVSGTGFAGYRPASPAAD